jgi:selenocysteine lyase/cysteine desulfurase
MILSVTFEKTTYNVIPHKFEAGTPPIAAAITLGAAVDYLQAVGMERIAAHETDLLDYATDQVNRLPGVHIIGTAEKKAAVLSFAVDGVHPHGSARCSMTAVAIAPAIVRHPVISASKWRRRRARRSRSQRWRKSMRWWRRSAGCRRCLVEKH